MTHTSGERVKMTIPMAILFKILRGWGNGKNVDPAPNILIFLELPSPMSCMYFSIPYLLSILNGIALI